MAFTFIAEQSDNGDGAHVDSEPIDVSGAKLIVLGVADLDGSATVSDNQGNTFAPLTAHIVSGPGGAVRFFYCLNPVTGTPGAYVASADGTMPSISVKAFTAAGAISLAGQNGAAGASSTTLSSGTVLPGVDGALFVAVALNDSALNRMEISYSDGHAWDAADAPPGFTYYSPGVYWNLVSARYIQATAGARDAIGDCGVFSDATVIAVAIVAFTESAEFVDGDPGDLVTVEIRDRSDNVRPFAQVDLCDEPDYYGGYKAPRLMALDAIVTGLSDPSGQAEHPTFGATLADPDNALRAMVEDATQKYVWGNPLIVRTVEDEARRAESPMRHEMIGAVQDWEPAEGMLFRFTGSSWLRRKLARKTSPPEFWVPLLDRPTFPLLPSALLTKSAQLPYGNLSDEAPAIDPGDIPPDLYPIGTDDPVWIAGLERHAWGGTFTAGTVWFWVQAIKDGKRHLPLAPSTSFTFDPPASSGVQLVFRSAMLPDLYRLMWSDSPEFHPIDNPLAGTYARYSDVLPADYPEGNNPYGGPAPEDAAKRFVPVTDPAGGNDYHALVSGGGSTAIDVARGAVSLTYIGELTIGGVTRSGFLLCRGAVKEVISVFVGGVRVTSTGSATQIEVPFLDDYATTFGANYIDIGGVRYTIIFATAQIAADAVSGAKPITVNVRGYETVGDTTGTLITSGPRIRQHFERNFLAADAGAANTLWLSTCPDLPGATGIAMQDIDSYDAAVAALAARLSGGYELAGIICAGGEPESALDVLASLSVDGDFDSGINRFGQTMVSVEPFEAPASAIVLTEMLHIVDRGFKSKTDQSRNFWNQIPFAHTKDYTGISDTGWFWRGLSIDDASVTNYDQQRKSGEIQFRFLRANSLQAQNTILDVVKRKRTRWRHPTRLVTLSAPYKASAEVRLGSVLRLDHIEGTGASGWVGHDVRVTRITTDLNVMLRVFDCYDLQPIYDGLDDSVDPSQTPQGLRAATSLVQLQQQVQNAVIDAAALQAEINILDVSKATGPSSAVDDRIVVFDGTSGVVVKDSGYTVADVLALGGGGSGGPVGATVLLDTQVASASPTLDFTSGITAGYRRFIIEIESLIPATAGQSLVMQVSTDGGATWETTNYWRALTYVGSGGAAAASTNEADTTLFLAGISDNTDGYRGVLNLFDFPTSAVSKFVQGQIGFLDNADSHRYIMQAGGWWVGAGAVNAIRLKSSSGNLTSGAVRLYGVLVSGVTGPVLSTDPSSPSNSSWWVTETAGSPGFISLRARSSAGVDVTVAEVTLP